MTTTYTPSFLPQQAVRDLMAPLLVSENDAGRLLSVPRSEVRRLIGEGALAVVEIGGYRRVTVGSICSYVANLAERAPDTRITESIPRKGPAPFRQNDAGRTKVSQHASTDISDPPPSRKIAVAPQPQVSFRRSPALNC